MLDTLPPHLLEKIITWSRTEAKVGKEACGVMTNDGGVTQILNSHPDPENNFRIRDTGYSKDEIKLIWHSHYKDSHPGEFTPSDLNLAHTTNLPILLYHTGFDEWDYYEPLNPSPWPLKPLPPDKLFKSVGDIDFYTGWRFSWGRSDCFSLVRRYFLGVLGRDIGEFPRPLDPTETLRGAWDFKQYWDYEQHGFVSLPPNTQPQDNDIFGIALRGGLYANHLAVMVDAKSNLILHSVGVRGRSRLDVFDDNWRGLVVPGGHGRLK